MKTLLNCLLFTKVDKLIVYQPTVNFIISKNQTVIAHRYLCSNISSRYGSRNEVAQLLAINWLEGEKKKKDNLGNITSHFTCWEEKNHKNTMNWVGSQNLSPMHQNIATILDQTLMKPSYRWLEVIIISKLRNQAFISTHIHSWLMQLLIAQKGQRWVNAVVSRSRIALLPPRHRVILQHITNRFTIYQTLHFRCQSSPYMAFKKPLNPRVFPGQKKKKG